MSDNTSLPDALTINEMAITKTIAYWSQAMPVDKQQAFAAAMRADLERAINSNQDNIVYGPQHTVSAEFAATLVEAGIDPQTFPGRYHTQIEFNEGRVFLTDTKEGVLFSQKYTPLHPRPNGTEAEARLAAIEARGYDFEGRKFNDKPDSQIETGAKNAVVAALGKALNAVAKKLGIGG